MELNGEVDMTRRFGNITHGNLVEATKRKFEKALESLVKTAIIAKEINEKFAKSKS